MEKIMLKKQYTARVRLQREMRKAIMSGQLIKKENV